MILVKCPLCGKTKKVYENQRFFRCCSMLHVVKDNILYQGARFNAEKKNGQSLKKIDNFHVHELKFEVVNNENSSNKGAVGEDNEDNR